MIRSAVLLCGALVLAVPLAAQSGPSRDGVAISVGGGALFAVACDACDGFSETNVWGASGFGAIRTALSPALELGVRATILSARDLSGQSLVTGAARWFPGGGGFYLEAGVGLARNTTVLDGGGTTGIGLLGEFGVELAVSDHLAVTPYAGVLHLGVPNAQTYGAQAGIGLTYR